MKHIFSISVFLSMLMLGSWLMVPGLALAQDNWQITDWQSDITIQPDGVVQVVENIAVDFSGEQKHGIYRDLPVVYQNSSGTRHYTNVKNISATQDSQAAQIDLTRNDANLRIRIGDPNRTITEKHQYQIRYQVTGVLVPYEKYDELYWNITGNGWSVPIQKASALVHLPAPAHIQASCYQGVLGSDTACIIDAQPQEIRFTATQQLLPGQGITIAEGYQKDRVPILIATPPKDPLDILIAPLSLVSFGLTAIIGIGWLLSLWWRYGRDSHLAPTTIVAEYEPPAKLRPAELGTLIDEKADTLDVTSTIVDLAVRGYLTITEIPKAWLFGKADYSLKQSNKSPDKLLEYEQKLLSSLFATGPEVTIASLKNKFYTDLAQVQSKLYKEVVKKELFTDNPDIVRTKYYMYGGLIAIIGAIFGYLVGNQYESLGQVSGLGVGIGGGILVTGLALLLLARAMPARTAHGREMYRKALGYKLFINTAERYESRFAENHNLFTELLPYAIVFGITGKLAQAMEKIGAVPAHPTWYIGTHPFNPVVFAQDINTFSSSLSTAIASTPSSSGSGGGGFSGGGFGGGGGGGW